MFRTLTLATRVLAVVALLGCTRQKAETVLVVGPDGSSVHGKVEFVMEGGQFRPDVWHQGTVVIFRVNEELSGQKGEAVGIYRINAGNQLERIGQADLSRSDEELAAQFGVKTNKEPR